MKIGYSPKYVLLADHFREEILKGKIQVGKNFLPDTELAVRYGVNKQTIANGMNILVKEGLISRSPGRGTVVLADKVQKRSSSAVGVFGYSTNIVGPSIAQNLIKKNLYPVWVNQQIFSKAVNSPDYTQSVQKIMEQILEDSPYGMIVEGDRFMPFDFLRRNIKRIKNLVFVLFNLEGKTIPGAKYVVFDAIEAGRLGGEYLIEKGHRKLTLIGPHEPLTYPKYLPTPQIRMLEGLKEVCKRKNVEFDEITPRRLIAGEKQEIVLADLFQQKNPPTAALLSYDGIFTSLAPNLKLLGKSCLGDLSVLGCYNSELVQEMGLSSMSVKVEFMAKKAVEMLMGECEESSINIMPEIVANKTVADIN